MKKIKGIITLLAGVLCCACSDTVMTDIEDSRASESEVNERLESAIAVAEQMIRNVEGTGTRSTTSRNVRSIETLMPATRSSDGTQWYVVNYEDDKGFCIVTDAQVESPVAAFSEKGELDLSDIGVDSPIATYLTALGYYGTDLFDDSESYEIPGDPAMYIPTGGIGGGDGGGLGIPGGGLIPNPGGGGLIPDPGIVPEQTIYITDPLIAEYVQEWGQSYPYNIFCPRQWNATTEEYEHGLVGCSAIACGMVMSYYEWPNGYGDHKFKWDIVKTVKYVYGNDTSAQLLLYDLGKPECLNIKYGLEGSSASVDNFPTAFEKFNYYRPQWRDFKQSELVDHMYAKNPVIIVGTGTDYNDNNKEICHAWVVDGYYIIKYNDCADPSDPIGPKQARYFHNIWGWYGSCNGYFRMPGEVVVNSAGVNHYYYKNLKTMSDFKIKSN